MLSQKCSPHRLIEIKPERATEPNSSRRKLSSSPSTEQSEANHIRPKIYPSGRTIAQTKGETCFVGGRMIRALLVFTLIGLTSAYPAAEQCRLIDGRKDRQACYDRQTASGFIISQGKCSDVDFPLCAPYKPPVCLRMIQHIPRNRPLSPSDKILCRCSQALIVEHPGIAA